MICLFPVMIHRWLGNFHEDKYFEPLQKHILNKKKRNLTVLIILSFLVFLKNPTYHRSIFIALVYVHHAHIFSTRLSLQITLYAT